jgi:hypothetical protein
MMPLFRRVIMRKLATLMVWLIAVSGSAWQAAADEQSLVLSRAGSRGASLRPNSWRALTRRR